MIDETKERLIVMGGTMEPGVFQVEVTHPGKMEGSIIHVEEEKRIDPKLKCGCDPVWRATPEAVARWYKHILQKPTSGTCLCSCVARRIE